MPNIIVKRHGDKLIFGMSVPPESTANDVLKEMGHHGRYNATIIRNGKRIDTNPATKVQDSDNIELRELRRPQ